MPETNVAVPGVNDVTPIIDTPQSTDASTTAPSAAESKTAPKKAKQPFVPNKTPHSGEPPKGPGITVRKSDWVDGLTLPAVDKNGKRIDNDTPNETITIPENVIDGYRLFVEKYVKDILRLQALKSSNPPIFDGNKQLSRYEAMKRAQAASNLYYPEDELMLKLFSEKDPSTNALKAKTPQQIRQMFEQDHDLLKSLVIIEGRYIRDTAAALGLRPHLTPGKRAELNKLNRAINIDGKGAVRSGLGRFSRLIGSPVYENGRGSPGIKKGIALGTTAGIGGSAGAVAGGILGAAIPGGLGIVGGAAIGAAIGPVAAKTLAKLGASGIALEFKPDDAARLQSITDSEIIRSRDLLGIDTDNPYKTRNLDDVRINLIELIYHRADFMENLGVPPENLDALDDQYLFRSDRRPEDNKTEVSRIQDYNYKGLLKQDEQARIQFAALHGIPTPTLTFEGERQLFRQAEQETIMHYLETSLRRTENSEDHLARLTKQIADREGENSLIKQQRTAAANEVKTNLTQDKETLDATAGTITNYQDKLKTISDKEREQGRILQEINAGAITDYGTALRALQELMNNSGAAALNIRDETGAIHNIGSLIDRKNTTLTNKTRDIGNIPTTLPRRRYDDAINTISNSYQTELDRIDREKILIEGIITRLRASHQQLTEARNAALDPQETKSATDSITSIRESLSKIAAWGINPATLNSMNISQIESEINNAWNNTHADGWPANENLKPEHRIMIRQAVIAIRARNLMRNPANIHNHVSLEANFRTINGLSISPEQMRAMDIPTLEQRADQAGFMVGNPARTTIIQEAKEWANLQLVWLQRSIASEGSIINTNINNLDRAISTVDLKSETEELEFIKKLYEDKDNIMDRAHSALSPHGNNQALLDYRFVNPATAQAEGYTQEETSTFIPRNVLEILNILTNYQNDRDKSRSVAFQDIAKGLGPNPNDRLGQILLSSFNFLPPTPLGYAPTSMLDEFSVRLSEGIRQNIIRERELRLQTSQVIDQLLKYSKSI